MEHHHHRHHHPDPGNRLGLVALLNLLITLAQLVGGLLAGSLALISDAMHNASDALALALAWWARRLKMRPADPKYTFGLRRAEILAALFNAATLIGVSVYLAIEALGRLQDPPEVSASLVVLLAALGLLVNGGSIWLLGNHGHDHGDLNTRAAWLHLAGDALTSLAVLLGGLAIWLWGWYWVDPLVTLAISAFLLITSWRLIRQTLDVLLMAVPPNLSLEQIENAVTALAGVEDIHHVHLWQLDGDRLHFEAHLVVADIRVAETGELHRQVSETLQGFGISHVTLQFECGDCSSHPAPQSH